MNKISSPKNTPGRFKRTFIGDRAFYNTILSLVLPIIVQNAVSNFVNLLDNIMVGQIGTAEMSGVAISNQLLFVFNLTIFGGLSGPSIFGAQYFGAGDIEGMRHTLRFKLLTVLAVLTSAVIIFLSFGDNLISLYLSGEGEAYEATKMLNYGFDYLKIMLLGLLPFSISQAYNSTLRESGEAMLPMKASLLAVLVNLVFNYILIFGKLGLPALGIVGAAIATVISRYVELVIIVVYTHRHSYRFMFINGLYRSFKIPGKLAKMISKKGMPLLLNELFWSMSMTVMAQIFSTCGLNVVAGINISSTVTNLFNVVLISMGAAVSVMIGQTLGAGDIARAKEDVWKLLFLNICACLVIGGILAAVSPFIPLIYNTTDDVRKLATHFMITSAVYMVFNAIANCCYFTIRSGGKTLITLLFDSVYSWVIIIPYTYIITNFTNLDIYAIYPLSYLTYVLKGIAGILIVRTGFWAQNVVSDKAAIKPVNSI